MNPQSGRLQRLLALSQETSAESRRALISETAQQFRDRSAASVRESQDLGEALAKLLPRLDIGERVYLANELANLKEAPTYLVRELAGDAPAVAAPILAASCLLVDEDLLAAVRKGGEERLCAIAQRPDLSRPVQAAIIKSGEKNAILALIQNPSFAPSTELLGSLIVRARSDESLASNLARRREMPVSALAELFFFLKREERLALTHALARNGEDVSAPPRPNPEGEAALLKAVRGGDRKGLLRVFDSDWKLAEASAQRILRDATCEALAVLCLGLGISRATYSTLAILMRPDAGDGASRTLSQFDRFSPAGARRIASEWAKGPAAVEVSLPPAPSAKSSPGPRTPPPAARPAPTRGEGSAPQSKVFGRLRPSKPKPRDPVKDEPPSTFGVTFGSGKANGI